MTRFFKNRQTFFAFFRFLQPLHLEAAAVCVFCGAFDYDTVFSTSSRPEVFFSSRFPSTSATPLRRNAASPSFSGAFDYDSFFLTSSTVFGFFSTCLADPFGSPDRRRFRVFSRACEYMPLLTGRRHFAPIIGSTWHSSHSSTRNWRSDTSRYSITRISRCSSPSGLA